MGVRVPSLAQQCKHTDKREPLVVWNTCLGAQVGIRFHLIQLQLCINDREEAICFCSETEQKQTFKQTSSKGTGMDEMGREEFCSGEMWQRRRGVVCASGGGWWWQSGLWSNTTPRSDHLSVFLYLLLFFVGEGVGVESHEKQKNSQSTCRSCLVK